MVENKKTYVVDASVMVKWVLFEPEGLENAMKIAHRFLTKEIKIIVPSICFFEIGNILPRKNGGNTLTFISHLRFAEMKEYLLNDEMILTASKLMAKYPKISFYDASYHALALNQGINFVTSDKKYYEATKKEGNIIFLTDYK